MKTRYLIVEERASIVGMYQGGTKGIEIVVALGHPKCIKSIVLKEFELLWECGVPKIG